MVGQASNRKISKKEVISGRSEESPSKAQKSTVINSRNTKPHEKKGSKKDVKMRLMNMMDLLPENNNNDIMPWNDADNIDSDGEQETLLQKAAEQYKVQNSTAESKPSQRVSKLRDEFLEECTRINEAPLTKSIVMSL